MSVQKPNIDIELNTVDRAETSDSAGSVLPCRDPTPKSAPADEHEPSSPSSIAVDKNDAEHQADSQPPRQRQTRPEMPERDGKKEDARFFGIPKYQPHSFGGAAGDRSYNYEEKYPADEPYHEAGDNARVWKVYLDEAEIYDDDMVRGFRDTIDSLLVFAALFSAVVTTFVVETSQALRPDYTQYSSQLLYEQIQIQRAIGNVTAIGAVPSNPASPEPSYTTSDIWVNGLFFTSLALSLATALLSVLVKQWIQSYTGVTSGTAKSRALVRQFRFTGLTKWRLPEIVGILPLLLHASLALFLIGLVIYVNSLHSSLSWALLAISGLTFSFYLASLFLPAIWIDCPYRISILYGFTGTVLWAARCVMHMTIKTVGGVRIRRGHLPQFRPRYEIPRFSYLSLKLAEIDAIKDSRYPGFRSNHHDRIILDAILWLHELSSNPTVIRAAARAVAGLTLNFYFMRNILESQIANTVSTQLLASAIDDLSKRDKVHNGDWIRASLNLMLADYATKWIFDDSKCIDASTLEHLQMSLSAAAGVGNADFVQRYIHSWSVVIVYIVKRHYLREPVHTWLEISKRPECNWASLDILKLKNQSSPQTRDLCENLQHVTNRALLAASSNGKLDVVENLLEKGVDVNGGFEGEESETCLHGASKGGHLDVVKLLLKNGADANVQGGEFGNGLQAASCYGRLDVVKVLLENGADVNAQGGEFGNALQAASRYGCLDVVKLLLGTGADVNFQGGRYKNALQAASHGRHLDVVQLLLDKGADSDVDLGWLKNYGSGLILHGHGSQNPKLKP